MEPAIACAAQHLGKDSDNLLTQLIALPVLVHGRVRIALPQPTVAPPWALGYCLPTRGAFIWCPTTVAVRAELPVLSAAGVSFEDHSVKARGAEVDG